MMERGMGIVVAILHEQKEFIQILTLQLMVGTIFKLCRCMQCIFNMFLLFYVSSECIGVGVLILYARYMHKDPF